MDLIGGTDKSYAKAVRKRLSRAGTKPRRTGEVMDPMERLTQRLARAHKVGPEKRS